MLPLMMILGHISPIQVGTMVRFDYGICRHCGKGYVKQMWGGISPQFYCTACGIVTRYGGRRYAPKKVSTMTLKDALDKTFMAIGLSAVPVMPFMEAVKYVVGSIPTIKAEDLNQYGYELKDGYITRRK